MDYIKIRKKEKLDMENEELKERFIDEKTGIEYIKKGDMEDKKQRQKVSSNFC